MIYLAPSVKVCQVTSARVLAQYVLAVGVFVMSEEMVVMVSLSIVNEGDALAIIDHNWKGRGRARQLDGWHPDC
ncbi:unnamed protein product [Heligmosomoides polygyrus]|uniref:Uncharacterized protein n=1 Tax=Heligmosomoides polygyrus TaxID=6339 RepID=A0A183G965_HELPZ|nr:unnamed protein product [Heligmosomoides polygyrus]